MGDALDLIVCRGDHQHRASLTLLVGDGGGLAIRLTDLLSAQPPIHLSNSTHGLELAEPFCRTVAKRLYRSLVFGIGLPLHLQERHTLHTRFAFQYTQSIAFRDTLDL